jgi:hypothetical protein
MVKAVIALLVKDQEAWSSEPEIVSEVAGLQSDYQTAEQIMVSLEGLDSKPYSNASNECFENAKNLCLILCNRMRVYAKRKDDTILLSFYHYNNNSITTGKRHEIIDRLTSLVEKAETLLTQLQGFKIDQAFLDSIRKSITSYDQSTDDRSNVKSDKKVKNQQNLPDVIHSIRQRLSILDDLVEGFIEDHDVVLRYKQSRHAVNYGSGKTKKNNPKTPPNLPTPPTK